MVDAEGGEEPAVLNREEVGRGMQDKGGYGRRKGLYREQVLPSRE
jgi:hypothetical protein